MQQADLHVAALGSVEGGRLIRSNLRDERLVGAFADPTRARRVAETHDEYLAEAFE